MAASVGVGEALAAATDALRARGIEQPRLDAELLLCEATGLDRAQLVARPETPLEGESARRFAEMVRRRLRFEPVAYILSRRGFRHLELRVDRRALVPRPETEHLVEVGLEIGDNLVARGALVARPPRVIDIGTGSGAIALAVASERADWQVTATDTSAEALALARENAALLGLTERVEFRLGTLPPESERPPDLILANLPYIPDGDWPNLPPDVREHEPRSALTAGLDGLDVIREVVAAIVGRWTTELPSIAFEIGSDQSEAAAGLLSDAGWRSTEVRRDLAGHDRVVFARR